MKPLSTPSSLLVAHIMNTSCRGVLKDQTRTWMQKPSSSGRGLLSKGRRVTIEADLELEADLFSVEDRIKIIEVVSPLPPTYSFSING